MKEQNRNSEMKMTLESLLTTEVQTSIADPSEGLHQLSYHEMADVPVQSVDLFEQLEMNLYKLSDLQKRIKFVMSEVRYQLKI